jgi:hypothetical protein
MVQDSDAPEAAPADLDAPVEQPAPATTATPKKQAAKKVRQPRAPRAKRGRRAPADFPPAVFWVVGLSGVALIVLLAVLVTARPVEDIADPADPVRLLVYALLLLGPLALFWAMARGMRMGLFWIYATASWAAFGYMMIFLRPPAPEQAAAVHYVMFLGLFALALIALLTPPLYALGWMMFSQRQRRHDLGRASRQAFLIAAYLVLLVGMNLFGVFNWLNALLLFVVFALAEFFFLSRA